MTAINDTTFADTPAHEHAAPLRFAVFGQALCLLVPFAIWFMPVDLDPTTKHGLTIVMFMVAAWITVSGTLRSHKRSAPELST